MGRGPRPRPSSGAKCLLPRRLRPNCRGIRRRQGLRDSGSDRARQHHGNGIAELTHHLGPTSAEHITVGERLQPRCLADREIASGAVGANQRVLAAWHAVIAGFKGLRGKVEHAAGMTGVELYSGLEAMIRDPFRRLWIVLRVG
jgi:hypothetical protein